MSASGRPPVPLRRSVHQPSITRQGANSASIDEDEEATPPKQLSIADRIAGLKLAMDQKSGSGGGLGFGKPPTASSKRASEVERKPSPEPQLEQEQIEGNNFESDNESPETNASSYEKYEYFLLSRFDYETLARALARQPPPIPVPAQFQPQSTSEDDVDYEDQVEETQFNPPPLPPRAAPPALPPRKQSQNIEDQKPPSAPPPLPQRSLPTKLPTPPPEQTYDDYEEQQPSETEASEECCLECRDFSVVDAHAAQFPRQNVTSLDQLAYDLTSPFETETDKARAMFTWMHYNVAYDAPSFLSGNIPSQGPSDTLRSGLAVCDGYAQLFVDLCERVGMQAHKVTGHGKGYGYAPLGPGQPLPAMQSNHAWNCVLLDGEWRLMDSCWGAGTLDGTTFTPRFNPSWFTASPVEFGKRHYPTDPSFQLLSEEEGGPMSWEDYILGPERPVICGEFYDHDLSSLYLEPSIKYLQGGQTVSFNFFKRCEHMSTASEDNYVYMVYIDGNMTPLQLNAQGGWSVSTRIPAKSGTDVQVAAVKTVGGRDAKGIGVNGFLQAKGRQAMAFSYLAMWKVA